MKKEIALIAAASISACILNACGQAVPMNAPEKTPAPALTTPSPSVSPAAAYRDGVYAYTGKPDIESFHVEGSMTVSGGKIISMEWKIVDPNGRAFDASYEDVYGEKVYKQQCRDNWSGLQRFVPDLIKEQDPKAVDTISGATWVYNKFEEAAKALLDQAK